MLLNVVLCHGYWPISEQLFIVAGHYVGSGLSAVTLYWCGVLRYQDLYL